MASWTDDINALSNFRPYVEQLPISAMVEVGVAKQQQYDQGVQKIQAQIERVAGLDVVRDVDKQYLQSKLNQLSGDLKKVAAGDFSNYQLVNSVGGMVNSVAKDKNVQNAVANTARYRKELTFGEELRQKGKLSPNREYDFQKATNEWLSNPNLDASFTGQYKEHIDVNKKVLDIIQKIHPNISVQDIPYTLNSDGSINTRSIAAAMQKQGVKGVDEGQIRTAINSMLDTNDLDELASQGRYNYRNLDTNSLSAFINEDYNRSKQYYSSTLDKLRRQLKTSSDVNEQARINESIKYFESLLGDGKLGIPGKLDLNHQTNLQELISNPDFVRANIYTKNYLDQIANGFSYKEVTNELVTNPLREDQWKQIKHNFDVVKEQHDIFFKQQDLALKQQEFALKLKEAKTKEEKDAILNDPYFAPSGDPTLKNINSLQNWSSYNSGLSDANKQIVSELIRQNSSIDQKISEQDILQRIDEYKDNKYIPKTLAEKAKLDKYLKNASVLDQMNSIYKEVEDQVSLEHQRKTGKKVIPLNAQLESFEDLSIPTPNGDINFSPKEVYDYLRKEKSRISTGPTAAETITIDDSNLTDREVLLKSALANRYGRAKVGSSAGSTGNPYIDSYIKELTSKVKENIQVQSNIDLEVANRLAPLTGSFATEDASINFGKEIEKKNFIADVSTIINADRVSKTADISYQPSEALSMLSKNAEDINFSFRRKGEDNYIVMTDINNPQNEQIIKVDEEFVRKNANLGQGYLNQNLDVGQILLRNGGSTNIFKDFDHSYYKAGEFGGYKDKKRTVTMPVSADLNQDGDQVFVTFKLKTSNLGVLEYHYPFPINIQDFESKTLPSLTDAEIAKWFSSVVNPNTEIKVANE